MSKKPPQFASCHATTDITRFLLSVGKSAMAETVGTIAKQCDNAIAERDALSRQMLTPNVFQRLLEWLREPKVRPASLAFTAGLERQIAYALEMNVLPELRALRVKLANAEAKALQSGETIMWADALTGPKPAIGDSVLVFGILEEEQRADTHEGYWDGKHWRSIRIWETGFEGGKQTKIAAEQWAKRPVPSGV